MQTDKASTVDERRAAKKMAADDPRLAKTKVKFSRAHIHRGVTYAAGDISEEISQIEADDLVAQGAAGKSTPGGPSFEANLVNVGGDGKAPPVPK